MSGIANWMMARKGEPTVMSFTDFEFWVLSIDFYD